MERSDTDRRSLRRSSLWGAGLGLILAFFLYAFQPFTHLIRLSYDEAYRVRPQVPIEKTFILYLDNKTYRHFAEEPSKFDRAHIAAAIDKLSRPGIKAKLIVLDIWYQLERSLKSDDLLAQAIARHGNVVLAAVRERINHREIEVSNTYPPIQKLIQAGGKPGLSEPWTDGDNFVRQFNHGTLQEPGFAWLAASLVGSDIAKPGIEPDNELWLNNYGPPGDTIKNFSFSDFLAADFPAELFKDGYVFIGSRPSTDYPMDQVDEFKNPYTRWLPRKVPGVELAATSFLNLVRGDPMRRMDAVSEFRLFVVAGVIFGAGFVWLRPWRATLVAAVLAITIPILSWMVIWSTHVWFSWMYLICLQLPAGLVWSYSVYGRRLRLQKEYLEQTLTRTLKEAEDTRRERAEAALSAAPTPAATPAALSIKEPELVIPEHQLVRRVGKGGYGEVWLATNAIGSYHVVKLIHRRDFNNDGPYEREFRGIQRFMPISRSHPGFVNLLQVGRNDTAGFFYCVMEAGDDEKTGQEIHPDTYAPKTLASELKLHGALKAKECVEIACALAEALDHLHRERLIHRDIKPANIIFVRGTPKLADIGLVTHVESTDREVSMLGTDGFMAPEGPGSPASDVYSLGKVLYEACMGLDRRRFPELPTALYDAEDITERMQLNRIILRACEPKPEDRYASAAEMLVDLKELARDMAGPS